MDINEIFEKNKNNILNLGVIVLALIIAFQIYRGIEEKASSLAQEKDTELKKNEISVEIASFEKKIDGFKKVFIKKDLGAVMDTVSAIARQCAVKVLSIKPDKEEARADYIKSSFALIISAPDYHALGNFISQVESYQDIYFVDEVKISLIDTSRATEDSDVGLRVNLKISTISYL